MTTSPDNLSATFELVVLAQTATGNETFGHAQVTGQRYVHLSVCCITVVNASTFAKFLTCQTDHLQCFSFMANFQPLKWYPKCLLHSIGIRNRAWRDFCLCCTTSVRARSGGVPLPPRLKHSLGGDGREQARRRQLLSAAGQRGRPDAALQRVALVRVMAPMYTVASIRPPAVTAPVTLVRPALSPVYIPNHAQP